MPKALIMCVDWEDPARHLVPETTKDNCKFCKCEVAVAPSSRKIIAQTGADIGCTKCVLAIAAAKETG